MAGLHALEALTEPCDTDMEEGEKGQGAAAMMDQANSYTDIRVRGPLRGGEEQPTLAAILQAVNKCRASVNNLQECFGGLKE